MLILTRERDQWIDIGADVSVCVIKIQGNKVRLGISAPSSCPVNRREITLKIAGLESGGDDCEDGTNAESA